MEKNKKQNGRKSGGQVTTYETHSRDESLRPLAVVVGVLGVSADASLRHELLLRRRRRLDERRRRRRDRLGRLEDLLLEVQRLVHFLCVMSLKYT